MSVMEDVRERLAPRRRATLLTLIVAICLGLTVAGCSADGSAGPGSVAGDSAESTGMPGGDTLGRDSAMESPNAVNAPPSAPDNREVISTGSLTLTVDDPSQSAARAVEIVERAGGRIDARSEQPETDHQVATARLTVRIPAHDLTAVLDDLKALGTVENVSITSTDVTSEAIDLDARIDALSKSVARLEQIMQNAANASDLIEAETALSQRQADLESYQSQRNQMSDQVSLSTVTIEMASEKSDEPEPREGFWGAIVRGWNALFDALSSMVVGVGLTLPWLGFFAVLAAVLYAPWRIVRWRRHPAAEPKAAASAPSAGAESGRPPG